MGQTSPTPMLRALGPPLEFDDIWGSALEGCRVGIRHAAGCYLPGQRGWKYILHLLSDWTLRHLDCSLCNLNLAGPNGTALCSVPVAWSPGAGRAGGSVAVPSAALPLSHRVSSHRGGARNVTLVSTVRRLKDMVNKRKTKLQRSCFSVLSDLYSLWIYFPLTPWN